MLLLLQYSTNYLIPDHEADAFRFIPTSNGSFITHLFGGLLRWDAHHFMQIANHGYVFEQSLAFFPLYPMLARFLALILSNIFAYFDLESWILFSFIVINITCFILSALCLYDLTVLVLGRKFALKATILFCFNPASIFFTAPYTEALFSYLTFKSMLNSVLIYHNLQVNRYTFVWPIILSLLTRSNGVLNLGFILYSLLCLYLDRARFNIRINILVIWGTFLVLICLAPFILFQLYCFNRFCKNFSIILPDSLVVQAKDHNFVLPGLFSRYNQSWCYQKIPLAYSYVQSHYWNVGFLEYYQFKQIPNFLLAAPIIYLLLSGSVHYFLKNFPKEIKDIFTFSLLRHEKKDKRLLMVYIIHSTFLVCFCLFNVHIQVITRMLCSASPIIYWFSADLISQSDNGIILHNFSQFSFKHKILIIYYLGYFVIGTIMFCNFLPWT